MPTKPKTKRKDGRPDRAIKRARNKRIMKEQTPPKGFVPATFMGRKTLLDPEFCDILMSRISAGDTLRGVCREYDYNEATVRNWIVNDWGGEPDADPPKPGLAARYARARELQAEAWADHQVEIADEATVFNAQTAKLRIETRKWLMGKNHVKRFGDKTTVQHEGGDKPMQMITSEMTLQEAADAYAASIREDE